MPRIPQLGLVAGGATVDLFPYQSAYLRAREKGHTEANAHAFARAQTISKIRQVVGIPVLVIGGFVAGAVLWKYSVLVGFVLSPMVWRSDPVLPEPTDGGEPIDEFFFPI